jgi:hypothetical protein
MRSYKKLPEDVKPGSQILCADGSIVLEVTSTHPKAGTVRAKCQNNAMLGCAPRGSVLQEAQKDIYPALCADQASMRACMLGIPSDNAQWTCHLHAARAAKEPRQVLAGMMRVANANAGVFSCCVAGSART